MRMDTITKIVINGAVSKGIDDIRTDPRRSIRKLVDLGSHFSRGRFQQAFFENTQKLLTDPQSAYYDLIYNVVNSVDRDNLTTVGVNVGYMSWTYGARLIRRHELENGYNVPWTIFFDLNRETGRPLDIGRIISEGKAMGIYTYMLFLGEHTGDLSPLLRAFAGSDDCAFIVFSDSEDIVGAVADEGKALKNVLLSVNCELQGREDSKAELSAQKRMCGEHFYYDDENAGEILSGGLIGRLVDRGCTFAFFIPKRGCSEAVRAKVYEYVVKCRMEQVYPLFMVDLLADVAYVDRVISVEACMACIRGDGGIITEDGLTADIEAHSLSLEQILSRTMPGAGYLQNLKLSAKASLDSEC